MTYHLRVLPPSIEPQNRYFHHFCFLLFLALIIYFLYISSFLYHSNNNFRLKCIGKPTILKLILFQNYQFNLMIDFETKSTLYQRIYGTILRYIGGANTIIIGCIQYDSQDTIHIYIDQHIPIKKVKQISTRIYFSICGRTIIARTFSLPVLKS